MTCRNAGPHSGDCKIHGKDGVAGSIPAGAPHSTDQHKRWYARVWARLTGRRWSAWRSVDAGQAHTGSRALPWLTVPVLNGARPRTLPASVRAVIKVSRRME